MTNAELLLTVLDLMIFFGIYAIVHQLDEILNELKAKTEKANG